MNENFLAAWRPQLLSVFRFITGLLHLTADAPSLNDTLALAETPLARLSEEELRPRREQFEQVLAAYR